MMLSRERMKRGLRGSLYAIWRIAYYVTNG